MSEATASATGARLQKNVLSLPNCIALSVALMGPVLAVVLNAPAAGPQAGAALPLSFLVALVVILFVGNTVVQFARVLPPSGSFSPFTSRGLGGSAGFFTGWLFPGASTLLARSLYPSSPPIPPAYV